MVPYLGYLPYIPQFKHLGSFGLIADPLTASHIYHDMIRDLSRMRLAVLHLPPDLKCDDIPRGVTFSHLKSLHT
jgi:hypothetical protein